MAENKNTQPHSTHRAQALLLIGVVVLAALVSRPFLEPRLPLTFDARFHYDTFVQLDHLFRQGILYPRWFPIKLGGFGAPFFQYYAPLSYYVALAFSLLGLDTLAALHAAWVLFVFGGAAGIALWVQEHLGVGAALVAAAALICSPYVLSNAFFRGGFAEQCAITLMPFALWASSRLAATGRPRYLVALALAYAGIVVAHTPTTFLFSPILLLYVLTLCLFNNRRATKSSAHSPPSGSSSKSSIWVALCARFGCRWKALLPQLGAIALGLGLSAFFWLPFLSERGAFHSEFAYDRSGLDYRRHFVALSDLVPFPHATMLRPALSASAGVLALVGLVRTVPDVSCLVRGQRPSRHSVLVWFAALVAGACAFMTLPASGSIWEVLPLLRFLQFPHRFLTVGMVFMAFVAGAGVRGCWCGPAPARRTGRTGQVSPPLSRRMLKAAALFIPVLVTVLLASEAWRLTQQVRYHPQPPESDVDAIMEQERNRILGARELPTMFLPATVQEIPPSEVWLQDGPGRLDVTSLPAGAALLEADDAPLRHALILSSPEPFLARLRIFDFAGWQAALDGQRVLITPTDPHGLISVYVPAGEHRLDIWFGSTPLRTAAGVLSVACAAALSLVAVAMRRRAGALSE